jgi:hypothetical protein
MISVVALVARSPALAFASLITAFVVLVLSIARMSRLFSPRARYERHHIRLAGPRPGAWLA